MIKRKITFAIFYGLIICSQPAPAQGLDLRETLQELTNLLAQQQKQLDAQRKELAEQRELIRQLQGGEEVVKQESQPVPATRLTMFPELVDKIWNTLLSL